MAGLVRIVRGGWEREGGGGGEQETVREREEGGEFTGRQEGGI